MDCKPKYKCITWHPRARVWQIQIRRGGFVFYHTCPTLGQAVAVRNKIVIEWFGEDLADALGLLDDIPLDDIS